MKDDQDCRAEVVGGVVIFFLKKKLGQKKDCRWLATSLGGGGWRGETSHFGKLSK